MLTDANTFTNEVLEGADGAPATAYPIGTAHDFTSEDVLLVNIGTGTSILHISKDAYRRVGGTPQGGGTFTGLGKLLAGADKSFADLLKLAEAGD